MEVLSTKLFVTYGIAGGAIYSLLCGNEMSWQGGGESIMEMVPTRFRVEGLATVATPPCEPVLVTMSGFRVEVIQT